LGDLSISSDDGISSDVGACGGGNGGGDGEDRHYFEAEGNFAGWLVATSGVEDRHWCDGFKNS